MCLSKLYSCEEVAKRYNVKVETVWKWVREHKISAIKIGKQYRITAEEIENFERK